MSLCSTNRPQFTAVFHLIVYLVNIYILKSVVTRLVSFSLTLLGATTFSIGTFRIQTLHYGINCKTRQNSQRTIFCSKLFVDNFVGETANLHVRSSQKRYVSKHMIFPVSKKPEAFQKGSYCLARWN
jgi:hypothetical protein